MGSPTMSALTTLSLTLLTLFHLLMASGNLLKVGPCSDPSVFLVRQATPGAGDTPIEHLLQGVFGCWYLSSIAGVLLTLHSQRAALLCPLLYHATIAAYFLLSPTALVNPLVASNALISGLHAALATMAAYTYCTLK